MEGDVCVTRELAAWRGVPFTPAVACSAGATTCRILMDVYAPTAAGSWPLVVIAPGGFMPPDQILGYTEDLGMAIADRGAVVMTANWRQGSNFGGDTAQSLGDVACAVGVARATGPAYGADAARVVLVGHSNGVWPVTTLGLTPSPMALDSASCDATSGSLRPDAIVVMSGLFDADAVQLAASTSAAQHIPVVIAQGGADDPARVAAARSFQDVLTANGWDSTLVEVPAADHPGILYAPAVIDAVMAVATGH